MPTPSIGRKVWIWPIGSGDPVVINPNQAFDGNISYVHSATIVNISFTDHNANPYGALRVALKNTPVDNPSYCWEWAP